MLFKNLFSKQQKIKGIIGYLGLKEFWNSCTSNEQNLLTHYYIEKELTDNKNR